MLLFSQTTSVELKSNQCTNSSERQFGTAYIYSHPYQVPHEVSLSPSSPGPCPDECPEGSEPSVTRAAELPPLKWVAPDEAGLVQFLVEEKQFNEDRVRKVVERIRGSRGKSSQGESPAPKPGSWVQGYDVLCGVVSESPLQCLFSMQKNWTDGLCWVALAAYRPHYIVAG